MSIFTEQELQNDILIIEACDFDLPGIDEMIMTEGASFQFLPKFKQYPELIKYKKLVTDAENVLNTEGISNNTEFEKIAALVLRIYDIIENIGSVLLFPFLIVIAPIPVYLLTRLFSFAANWAQFQLAKSATTKSIARLKKLLDKSDNEQEKEKIEALIEKLQNLITSFDKSEDDFEESVNDDDDGDLVTEGFSEDGAFVLTYCVAYVALVGVLYASTSAMVKQLRKSGNKIIQRYEEKYPDVPKFSELTKKSFKIKKDQLTEVKENKFIKALNADMDSVHDVTTYYNGTKPAFSFCVVVKKGNGAELSVTFHDQSFAKHKDYFSAIVAMRYGFGTKDNASFVRKWIPKEGLDGLAVNDIAAVESVEFEDLDNMITEGADVAIGVGSGIAIAGLIIALATKKVLADKKNIKAAISNYEEKNRGDLIKFSDLFKRGFKLSKDKYEEYKIKEKTLFAKIFSTKTVNYADIIVFYTDKEKTKPVLEAFDYDGEILINFADTKIKKHKDYYIACLAVMYDINIAGCKEFVVNNLSYKESSDVSLDSDIHSDIEALVGAVETGEEELEGNDMDEDELDDNELEELEKELGDIDLDDEEEVDLDDEEEIEADNFMMVAATPVLLNDELNAVERVAFTESEDFATAVSEGFVVGQAFTEKTKFASKTVWKMSKKDRIKQLFEVGVAASARAHNDRDYKLLEKVYKKERELKKKLRKKYKSEATKRVKVYIRRLTSSKSETLKKAAKEITDK